MGSSVNSGSVEMLARVLGVVKKLVVNSRELFGRNGKNMMLALMNITRKTKLSAGVMFTET